MKKLILILTIFFSFSSLINGQVRKTQISLMRQTADSLHSMGRTDSALLLSDKIVKMAKSSGNKTEMVGAFAGRGVYLRSLGRIEEALSSYEKGLEIATSKEFRNNPNSEAIEEIATLYINLSVLNLDMQNKDEAEKNAVFAADWCVKSDDSGFKSMVLGVVGSVLTGCGNLEEAVKYQEDAYKFALKSKDKESAFRAAAYNMLLSDRLGKKKEAQEWREKCEELFPEVPGLMARVVYYQAECSIAMKNNQPRKAIDWFKKILALEGIDNLPFLKYDVYNNLHQSYAEEGDYRNAYSTLKESNVLRDSLWAKEKEENLRDLTVKYETKETQLALTQSEARRAKVLMWLFAALGLLLLGGIVFIIYASRQRKRRLEKDLEIANLKAESAREVTRQYLEGLESERIRIAKELHDGVCNDLLVIEKMINRGEAVDNGSKMIAECRESVRRISHELLPPEFSYATLEEVAQYFISKQIIANAGKIEFFFNATSDLKWSAIPENVALEVYRIMQEAVGNSVKHSDASEIEVNLTYYAHDLSLTVKDNGRFLEKGVDGKGLESIRKRSYAIGGDLTLNCSELGGTELNLIVKLAN